MKKPILQAIAVLAVAGIPSSAFAQLTAFGLSSGGTSFVTFDISNPGLLSSPITINNLGGETISAIDFRPFNNTLYGYSSANKLFSINTSTGNATLFSNLAALTPATPPAGNSMGSDVPSFFPPNGVVSIDVNPTVSPTVSGTPVPNSGALRILDTTGESFRYVFDLNTLNRDDTLTGTNTTILGAAYTFNDASSATASTRLFVIGSDSVLYLQNPPNDGVLTAVGTGLGQTILGTDVGFDVPVGGTENAYASYNDNFYSVNLTTGSASLIGQLGLDATTDIVDIAVSSVPEASTTAFMLMIGAAGAFVGLREMKRKKA